MAFVDVFGVENILPCNLPPQRMLNLNKVFRNGLLVTDLVGAHQNINTFCINKAQHLLHDQPAGYGKQKLVNTMGHFLRPSRQRGGQTLTL